MNKETYTLSRTSRQVKPGYKKTPVGIIPEDWEVKTLGEIVANKGLIRGPFGSALKKDFFVPIGYKVYEQQNAIYKDFERGSYFVDEAKFQELRRFAVRKNDFIMSCSGTIGELYQIPGNYLEGVINQALLLIRLNPLKILYGFFENIFQTPLIKNRILESQGGAIKNLVGMNQIRKLKLPIPPLDEQKSIANCLSAWDSGIKKLSQLIQAKKQQKEGLMQQLLSGKKRLSGFNGKWKEVKVQKFAREYKEKNQKDKKITVLSCTKYDGLVPSLEYFGRKVYGDDLSKYKKVPYGYFAYATNHIEEGSIGIQNLVDVGLVSPMYTVFNCSKEINNNFIYLVFKSHDMINEYNRRMEGSINRRGGLRWNSFKKIKLKLPSLEEQTAIANILQTADKEIELLEQKLSSFHQQKKGLMQVLLTGEKRLIE